MGIYYGRGFEYLIVLSRDISEDDLAKIKEIPNIILRGKEMIGETRDCIVVVDMKDADDRLVETSYYKCQEDNWFHPKKQFAHKICRYIVELTEDENERLGSYMDHNVIKRHVKDWGWFDVMEISSTL